MRTVQQRVGGFSDTARVRAAGFVTGEGTPFGSGVDDTFAENQAAVGADGVARGVLVDDVCRVCFAFGADSFNLVVGFPAIGLERGRSFLGHGVGNRIDIWC